MSHIDDNIKTKLEKAFEEWTCETALFIKQGQKSDYVFRKFRA